MARKPQPPSSVEIERLIAQMIARLSLRG